MNDVITAPAVSAQDDTQATESISHENWTSMIKPKRLEISYGTEPSRRATFIAAPLERGFGLTLGNSLRRVLLSHLHGAAVTSIHIEGVLHEFSSIPGVVEDVTDIILNIKALAIRLLSDGSKRLSLNVKGPKVVTAGDITVPGGVEIMNKDFVLFNIDKDASVNIEMTVDHGKGYRPASAGNAEGNVIGDIPIDAIFTPVKRVSYKVDNVRVGRDTDYDRVTFEIETNGTVSPENALAIASNILRDQLQSFIKFDEPQPEVAAPTPQLPFNSNLLKRIDEMELSVRSANCLKSDNIIYIGDLVHRSERDMLCTPNFGRKSLNEIKEVLATMGLHLGMKVVSWPPENIEELAQHTRETMY